MFKKTFHLNRCTHLRDWSWTVAPCRKSWGGYEWFSRQQNFVGEVSIDLQVELNSFSFLAQKALVGQDLPTVETSRSHSDTPHLVGILWTSDQAWSRDLYLTTHNTHKRQTSTPSAGIETVIRASKRPQPHAIDITATGIG